MSAGDGFIYYSPKIALGKETPCKSFTAIGFIRTGTVYQVEMTPTFHPFRIDIDYLSSQQVPISSLLDQLELTKAKGWGMQLRRGLVELCKSDFELISKAMASKT